MKTMLLELDELDYTAVQRCIARRQQMGRNIPGVTGSLLPDGGGNLAGRLVAEICRGWDEMLDLSLRGDRS